MTSTLSLSALVAFATGSNEGDLQIETIVDQPQFDKDSVSLPSSCVGADDGYQWMKLLEGDEYPAVHQLCDNEYMVLDINEDSNIVDYFSSYTKWHHSLGGPLQMDNGNWEEWWLPNSRFLNQ